MISLIHPDDKYQMNWIEGNKEWGTVICPDTLTCKLISCKEDGNVRECYQFTNHSPKTVFVQRGEISVYATFNDSYEEARLSLTKHCHAHIWCGGEVSYILGLRMGGEAPHLGLSLTKGSLCAYSIERDEEQISNDRGDIMLHPSPFTLEPGETYELEWLLFWHEGEADFYRKLKDFGRFIEVKSDRYVYEVRQKVNIKLIPSFAFSPESVCIKKNGVEIPVTVTDKMVDICEFIEDPGAFEYQIKIGGIDTVCRIFVQMPLEKLIKKRCRFITEYQQYHNKNSRLNGAYLVYDNDEHKLHYDNFSDHNAGRERVGMGVLLAMYLQNHYDGDMMDSLKLYIDFVYRELYDEESGEVFNDAGRDRSKIRLYNYPWMAQLFIELYKLFEDKKYICDAYKVMKYYYEHGGADYYAVEVPLLELTYNMEMEGMDKEIRNIIQFLYQHARNIIKQGFDYPSIEVDFEQRTVASAANMLLQIYTFQKEKRFLSAAESHIHILGLFNGHQPDYRLYECPIRHWDSFWFGKKRLFGDTFPHYWSALTGSVFEHYSGIMGKKDLNRRAAASFGGAISMFRSNGSAYCANLFPFKVNGVLCGGPDPWANDQDWALYYACRYKMWK